MPAQGRFIGYVEAVEPTLIGWIVDRRDPAKPLRLNVTVDGSRAITLIAGRPRFDVAAAGHGGPDCGFALRLPRRLFDGRAHRIELHSHDGERLLLPGLPSPIVLGPPRAVTIAPIGGTHLGDVAGLLRHSLAEFGLNTDAVDESFVERWIEQFVATPSGRLLGAWVEGYLVGYVALQRTTDLSAAFGAVAISVLRPYRRRGLGERLLCALLTAVSESGDAIEVWLSVAPDNLPAQCLYTKLAFVLRDDPPPSLLVPANYLAMAWQGRSVPETHPDRV